MILVSEIMRFALPIILLLMVLAFWKRCDAVGIDARKDRKSTKRRLTSRVRVNWPVSIGTVMGTVRGRVIDVGSKGLGLFCVQPVSLGEVIDMTVEAPGHPIQVEAEVVRCDTRHHATGEAPYHGVGVSFRGISEENRAFLATLMETGIRQKTTENVQD